MERWLCSASSPIFRAITEFLESGSWYRVSGLVAGAVIVRVLAALLFLGPSPSGSSTCGVIGVGCALANAVAFASYRPQVVALVGADGLSPAADALCQARQVPFHRAPSVFRLLKDCTDDALVRACDLGLACSAVLVVLPLVRARIPVVSCVLTPLLWFITGAMYLSLIAVSGNFLGLQSDSNLVEVDALMAVLALVAPGYPHVTVQVMRFFAFRKMLGCGVCKYYGSPMWRGFTALRVHYFTQPLVNPRSCRAHLLPDAAHRFGVLATFVVEVVLPFLAWGPRPLRLAAWGGFSGLNAGINLCGNYGFIGFLNTMENLSLTDDGLWGGVLAAAPPLPVPLSLRAPVAGAIALYVALSLLPLARAAKGSVGMGSLGLPAAWARRLRRLDEAQRPFRLVNYQGKFAGMHDFRWEPILEGSSDGGITWRQFRWRYKLNSGPQERGVVLWLHLPRLDWLVWFLPMAAARGREPPRWYYRLLEKLSDEDPEVLGLLDGSPFQGEGGLAVRSRLERCEIVPGDEPRSCRWVFRPLSGRTPMDIVVKG